MLTHFKNKRTNKNDLLKVICFTALLLSNALQAMDVPNINEMVWNAAAVGYLDQAGLTQGIDKGADVNAKDQATGLTPLMIAAKNAMIGAKNDHLDVCTLLIKNGADVDVLDYEGRTPLNLALICLNRNPAQAEKAKELCELIIDAMLGTPINQVKLPAIALTPEQTTEVNALLGSLKSISPTKLNRDVKRLIVQDFINALKRKNLIDYITTQIMIFEFEEPLRQELLDYLNSRIELQIKENPQMMQNK
jgi:ankyrin repeat protein